MAYVVLSDLLADIPPDFLTQALDDDGDGVADPGVFDAIAARVSEEIDGGIGRRYPLPLVAPYPAFVTGSAKTLACDRIYKRRGIEDMKNPWAKAAAAIRTTLQQMAQGETPVDPTLNRQDASASIVTERMAATTHRGRRNSA